MATFFRFQKGTPGAAAAHMGYISRSSAVREGPAALLTRHLPEQILETGSYAELRTNLASYAWAREEGEQARFRGKGECRTHFRALFSFECPVPIATIRELVSVWLGECFPQARAACFIHTDTAHPHAHLWLDARGIDGKKLDLPPSLYRRLDEVWNRLYSRALGRDEEAHLEKKATAMRRPQEGGLCKKGELTHRQRYHARERRNAGGATLDQAGTRRNERTAPGAATGAGDRKPAAHPLLEVSARAHRAAHEAAHATEGAVQEAHALHAQLERLGPDPRREEPQWGGLDRTQTGRRDRGE